jgi:penicillin-binding protein 1C
MITRLRVVGFFFLAAAIFPFVLRLAPLPAALASPPRLSTEFLDRHGETLRLLLVEEQRYQRTIPLDAISPHLVAATVAAEDSRFFVHPGIDPVAIARAAFNTLRGVPRRSGASTITQQLVKQTTPGPRTLAHKLRESFLALCVERHWTKDRILSEYLNRLDYGNLRIGIASASAFYFGKPPSDLTPAESAFLAALPNAPSHLNPHHNPDGARQRQQWILERMRKAGDLSSAAFLRATSETLAVVPPDQIFAAPHFVDLLLQRRDILPAQGGPVRTTLDLPLTRRVEQILQKHLSTLTAHNATAAAAVVLHNPSGEVLALAGTGDYFAAGSGQINGAWMPRSPGSALKPFTYLLALERGASPATIVPDIATTFSTATGPYRPSNYNHRFQGPVSLRHALGNSLNIPAVRTLENVGGPAALHHLLRALGLSTLDFPPDYYGPGLTLGNGEVRLLELANAYGTIARGGIHRPFRLLADHPSAPTTGPRLFSEASAYLLSDMLADNRARAASFGLNSHLVLPFQVAAKTGTSSNYRDNWVCAYTPEFTVAVWVGNPNNSPMLDITGVTGAAPAMNEIFLHLHKKSGTTWFARPPAIREWAVHSLTGHAVAATHPSAVNDIFLRPPTPASPADYDPTGRVLLPAAYRDWLASPHNNLGTLATSTPEPPPLRITSPTPGTLFFIDPDLPLAAQRIPLRTTIDAPLEWSSPTLPSEPSPNGQTSLLREGVHIFTVRSPTTNESATTWIEVRQL